MTTAEILSIYSSGKDKCFSQYGPERFAALESYRWGAQLALSVERETLDLGVESESHTGCRDYLEISKILKKSR